MTDTELVSTLMSGEICHAIYNKVADSKLHLSQIISLKPSRPRKHDWQGLEKLTGYLNEPFCRTNLLEKSSYFCFSKS